MKENGIGRPSTRAAIIETLFRRKYIYRERKNIVATAAGIELIATINDELLKSAKLTGLWENKLRRIERGQYSAAEFIDELKQMISQIVLKVLTDNSLKKIEIVDAKPTKSSKSNKEENDTKTEAKPRAPRKPRAPKITSLDQIICPVCGTGHLLRGKAAYGCSGFREGCAFRLPFDECPADMDPAKLARKISKLKQN